MLIPYSFYLFFTFRKDYNANQGIPAVPVLHYHPWVGFMTGGRYLTSASLALPLWNMWNTQFCTQFLLLFFKPFTAFESCELSEIVHKTSYLPVCLREIVHVNSLLGQRGVIKRSFTQTDGGITPVNNKIINSNYYSTPQFSVAIC